MNISRRRFATLAGGILLAGATSPVLVAPAQAAPKKPVKTTTPTIRTVAWAGQSWEVRDSAWSPGGPAYNGSYSDKNVVVNADGTLTMNLTNPTGSNPVSSEIIAANSTGYGTYTLTATGNFDNFHPDAVFGNLFLYDSSSTAVLGHNEIDGGEISRWGHAGGPQVLTDTYYPTTAGVQTGAVVWPAGLTTATFTFTWLPGSITWDAYAGSEATGTSFLHSAVNNTNVPVPRNQKIHVNLWAFKDAYSVNPANMPSATVTLNSFKFVPAI
jgi:hypothetical protein